MRITNLRIESQARTSKNNRRTNRKEEPIYRTKVNTTKQNLLNFIKVRDFLIIKWPPFPRDLNSNKFFPLEWERKARSYNTPGLTWFIYI